MAKYLDYSGLQSLWAKIKALNISTFTNDSGYVTSSGVTSVRVQATSPVVSSSNTAQTSTLNTTISLADAYGDTKNPYGNKNINLVLASPSSGSAGVPTFRALVASDIPTITKSKISDFPTTWALSNITDADDLKAIEAISGTSGLLKKTAANTWTLDTNTYVTSSGVTSVRVQATSPVVSSSNTAQTSTLNTTISLADAYGDTKNPYGSKNINLVLASPSSGSAGAPSFRSLVAADIPTITKSKISDFPTTWALSNITDADDLKAIEALSGTSGLLKKTGANTWTLDTSSYVTSSGVTSVRVQATSPVVSSVNTAQSSSLNTTISLADAYGDTKNPYGNKNANLVLASPSSGNAAAPSFRSLVAADIPSITKSKISDFPTIPAITLNGTATTSPSFYAPTSVGTDGYVLKSGGSGAPSWVAQSTLSVGSATTATKATQDASGNVITTTYRKLDNDVFDSIDVIELNADQLVVNGTGRFVNGLYGDLTGNVVGSASSATEFSAEKTVALTGDVTGSASSKAGWSVATTLSNSGVTAGSYGASANASPGYGGTFSVPYITVDAKGRVTAASTKTITLPANIGTVTSVGITAGTGISVSGSPVTSSGSITVTNAGVTGVKGNTESSYRTGQVNLTAANIGAVATSGDETVAGNKTFSGITTLSASSIYPAYQNTIITANAGAIIQSPMPKYLWHDVIAFCKATTPTFYTTTNGTTWTTATLEKRLFAHMNAWGSQQILNSSIQGSRWVWHGGGFAYSSISWIVLGITYNADIATFDLLLETTGDATASSPTWTTLCSISGAKYNQQPIWIKTSGPSGTNDLRLTITRTSGDATTNILTLCAIEFLTTRWGDQGKGSEFEYPYNWDGTPNIYPIQNNTSNLGSSSNKWNTVYASTFSGNLTGDVTGNATTATTATKLGSSNVGAADRPIYLSSGTATQTTYRMAGTNATATTALAITDNLNTGIWYVNGTNSTDLYSQADGAAYVNKYSDSWIAEIYQDYRTGQIALRGKNNGTWQPWRKVLDSGNYQNYNTYGELNAGNLIVTGSARFTNGILGYNPDWNENDPNASGYIQNRICYDGEPEMVEILSTTFPSGSIWREARDVIWADEGLYLYDFDSYLDYGGIQYSAQIGNTTYTGTTWSHDEGGWYLTIAGNPYLYNPSYPDNGQPFFTDFYAVSISNSIAAPNLQFSLSFLTGIPHQINNKYLPGIVLQRGSGRHSVCISDSVSPQCDARGEYSVAEGAGVASGYYSHAEGEATLASGGRSHAEGCYTQASGDYSHAEGNNTRASGDYSHTEGGDTKASGDYSHAEGTYTTASGDYSHAEGLFTTANHRSQHVFGEYNVLDPSSATASSRGNYIEIVGKGTNNSRSNARTLDWSGNEVLAGKLTVGAQPTANMDVATKQYVDGLTLSISSNVISLKQGSTTLSSVTLPVYSGGVS